jgi:hypothetical protein
MTTLCGWIIRGRPAIAIRPCRAGATHRPGELVACGPAAAPRGALADRLAAGPFECFDDLDGRIDHPPHIVLTRLHPLNRRHRDPRKARPLASGRCLGAHGRLALARLRAILRTRLSGMQRSTGTDKGFRRPRHVMNLVAVGALGASGYPANSAAPSSCGPPTA